MSCTCTTQLCQNHTILSLLKCKYSSNKKTNKFFLFTDLKLHLQSTDYGNFLANEPSPLTVSVIDDKLKEKLVVEFQHLRNHCMEPLATFLDYITYVYLVYVTI